MPGALPRSALRFVESVGALGWPMAVASSSRNANQMMRSIHFGASRSLLDDFSVNVCGRDLRQGKPHTYVAGLFDTSGAAGAVSLSQSPTG
jgi:beta-phosphoglucomutase-like phosphatase (HAD superfamily)